MLCCISSGSTIDEGISDLSAETKAKIVPGVYRPESELDWEEITVFQWPNSNTSEGYQKPASVLGSVLETDKVRKEHEIKLAAARKRAKEADKKSSRKGSAPTPPAVKDKLPGVIPAVPAPPPLPPGRDDLPHLTARRLKSSSNGQVNRPEEPSHRQAIPLHGNLQLNFSHASIDDIRSLPPGTAVDETEQQKTKKKVSGSTKKKLSLKLKRPTFLSSSAFGTSRKRKSTKTYKAPDPPGFNPVAPSSIDTGISEGRLPLDLGMTKSSGGLHWESPETIEEEELSDGRDRSPSENLVGKYDPKNYIKKVPQEDASGNELPQWKRQIIAKQFAEKALQEDEETLRKAEEEAKFKDMPGWKRALLEKREAEDKVKRDKEAQDIAAIEWAKRNPHQTMPLDEDGLPLTPWQAEIKNRRDSKSSGSSLQHSS